MDLTANGVFQHLGGRGTLWWMIVYHRAGRSPRRRPRFRALAAAVAAVLSPISLAGCGLAPPTPALDPEPGRETAPPAATGASPGPGTTPDYESLGALAAVQVRVVIPAAGVDEMLALTTDEVFAASGETIRLAACGPFHATAGLLADVYSVSIVDTGASGAIARFEVIPTGEVTGPGEYPAIGSVQGTDGQSFPLDGTITIHSGLLAGEFALQDPSGNPVTGDYTCQTN